jgi:hypothetical protein
MSETAFNCTAAASEAVIETNVAIGKHGISQKLNAGRKLLTGSVWRRNGGGTQREYPKLYPDPHDQGQRVCEFSSPVTRSSGLHEFDLL